MLIPALLQWSIPGGREEGEGGGDGKQPPPPGRGYSLPQLLEGATVLGKGVLHPADVLG